MVDKLKELYNDLDVDLMKIELYFKNCTEVNDWYYNQLLEIYELSANLPTFTETEECHGVHEFKYYTEDSLDELNLFINNLNKLLKDYGKLNDDYKSSKLIN